MKPEDMDRIEDIEEEEEETEGEGSEEEEVETIPETNNHPDVQKLLDLVGRIALDANKALTGNNKVAGRRARVALSSELKPYIAPFRKSILDSMK